MGYEDKDVEYKNFCPHDKTMGTEILRWVIHKISHNPREECKIRTIISIKDVETTVFIQEWHNTAKPDGYVNVVHQKEICDLKESETDKETYQDALIQVSHRAIYNACVDFIIKIS